MFKKFLSLALVVMMLMSVVAISVSAAQVEVAEDGASASVAELGADSDAASQGAESDAASTGAGDVIKYDNSSTNWAGPVQFFIYDPETGTQLISWGSKKLNGEDEGGNIWSKDVSDYGMESGKQYAIIFADATSGDQTYDLMMDSSCIGDTGYATGKSIENPVDSNKTAKEAKWKSSSLGPRLQVTSIGNVVGETCPDFTSKKQMFTDFLKNTLENARQYAGKDDQTLIDDTAKALGIGKSDVEACIKEAGVTVEWSKDKSTLADESSADADSKGSGGSGGGSSNSSSSSSSGNSSKASSGTSTTGSSGSSSKSGSASNTQTGQTETVIFIMLGVMVAAAGVIFFARKKERT